MVRPGTPEDRLDELERWRREEVGPALTAWAALEEHVRERFRELHRGELRQLDGGRVTQIPGTLTRQDRANLDRLATLFGAER